MVRLLPLRLPVLPNPVGLAAGFDKNADILPYLPYFGFGQVEIGTVTPKPQGGNEKPRLFRIPKDKMLFNRMGFNNLGAGLISERVRKAKPKLPKDFLVGVNLGKNKSTPDEEAASDYAKVAKAFLDCADFFVINVSSPNTPGLRSLQNPEALTKIVLSVQKVLNEAGVSIPLYVKLAPEIEGDLLKSIIQTLEAIKITGFVLTNTLGGSFSLPNKDLTGGYSGQNLSSIALQRLKEAKTYTSLPIISVGGVMNEEQALERMKEGASAVQLYTGWIYQGPFFPKKVLRTLITK